MDEAVIVPTEDQTFSAHVARPLRTPAPAAVDLHEVFGANCDIRQTCREFARQRFIAMAPDLFWRLERGVALNTWSDEE